jgi:hypothetical protein
VHGASENWELAHYAPIHDAVTIATHHDGALKSLRG